jgi:epoxyqueuosine reductase QueG
MPSAERTQSLGFARTVRGSVESGIKKWETCHISQEVCPWNSFSEATGEAALVPRAGLDGAELIELMGMLQEEFSRRFKGSAVKRTKRRGLLRNVAVALATGARSKRCLRWRRR